MNKNICILALATIGIFTEAYGVENNKKVENQKIAQIKQNIFPLLVNGLNGILDQDALRKLQTSFEKFSDVDRKTFIASYESDVKNYFKKILDDRLEHHLNQIFNQLSISAQEPNFDLIKKILAVPADETQEDKALDTLLIMVAADQDLATPDDVAKLSKDQIQKIIRRTLQKLHPDKVSHPELKKKRSEATQKLSLVLEDIRTMYGIKNNNITLEA